MYGLYLAAVIHLTEAVYAVSQLEFQGLAIWDKQRYSLATWAMPFCQLYMFVSLWCSCPVFHFFLKCLVFKNLTRCFSVYLWVFWVMNWNQTQLSESKMCLLYPASLLALYMQQTHSPNLWEVLCCSGEPILVFSKIQLLLHLFSPQMVEIKQISIIPHGKEMNGFCSFQAIHHFWKGVKGQLSSDTSHSHLRKPT